MPSWGWLALIAAAGVTLVVVIALRRQWDKQAGAAEYRADTAEKTSELVKKQAAIVVEERSAKDVADDLDRGVF